jgi:hypothetical protein
MKMRVFVVCVAGALLCAAARAQVAAQPDLYADPQPAQTRSAPAWQRVELGARGHRYRIPVYASRRLDAPAALRAVQRIVIVVHDERREAEPPYDAVTALYAGQAEREADTLTIAPRFPGTVDAGFGGMPAWRRAGWMDGLPSVSAPGRPAPVGAYQVLDDLLRELTAPGRLPALHAIVLAGHGGGGQMVQRYAVLNPLDESLRAAGLALTYVVANADSYLYLSPERPTPNGRGYARYERGICPTYDQYRYGLDNLPAALDAYEGKLDRARLAARYAQRHVVYLLGGADNNPEDPGLDKGCGAEAQGATRLARGLGYWGHETARPPARGAPARASRAAHQGFVAVGVGHDEADLYGSACGAQALLGDGDWAVQAACVAMPARKP